jgi:hypothetical protein
VEVEEKNIVFPLAEGTPDERSVPLDRTTTLGDTWDHTFGALRVHLQAVQQQVGNQIHRHPVGSLVLAIWTTWSYAAHDIKRLRDDLSDLQKTIALLNEKIAKLEAASTKEPAPDGESRP